MNDMKKAAEMGSGFAKSYIVIMITKARIYWNNTNIFRQKRIHTLRSVIKCFNKCSSSIKCPKPNVPMVTEDSLKCILFEIEAVGQWPTINTN